MPEGAAGCAGVGIGAGVTGAGDAPGCRVAVGGATVGAGVAGAGDAPDGLVAAGGMVAVAGGVTAAGALTLPSGLIA